VIDAHAHLDDPRFANDLDTVIARAAAAGLTRILSCAEDVASAERNLTLARRFAMVRVAVGVHPHRAASWSDDVAARLRDLARNERVVAIGEIGVDLSGRSAPRDTQVRALEGQLRLARELDLPVVVHVRDAGALAREVVDRAGPARGMIHCYSEGPAEVAEWTRRGFVVSFAGTVTYPTNRAIRQAAAVTPTDAILAETDAPYLAPQGHRGRRNEPAFVAATFAALAEARAEPLERLAEAIEGTARGLFGGRWA
jgi:TatD DNase family protein